MKCVMLHRTTTNRRDWLVNSLLKTCSKSRVLQYNVDMTWLGQRSWYLYKTDAVTLIPGYATEFPRYLHEIWADLVNTQPLGSCNTVCCWLHDSWPPLYGQKKKGISPPITSVFHTDLQFIRKKKKILKSHTQSPLSVPQTQYYTPHINNVSIGV